jgi:hypothetical protein
MATATVLPLGIRNGTAPDASMLPQGLEPSIAEGGSSLSRNISRFQYLQNLHIRGCSLAALKERWTRQPSRLQGTPLRRSIVP